ncbi:MAG: Likely secreted protein containing plastocyanin protein [uncultured bacterium]|nr:MAG: Likely secreted protein containing plastocyanin protein [uncultured bacterium]
MNQTFVLVNAIGVILIFLIIWWFFGNKHSVQFVDADQPITIVIKDGMYQPALISTPAGKPIKLQFIREDDNACASSVIFTQLNFSYQLPLNQVVQVLIPPQEPGEIDFTCQAGTYRGKLVIV